MAATSGIWYCGTPEAAVFLAIADLISAIDAADRGAPALLALPGGRSVGAVIPVLAPLLRARPHVRVIPVDERWVAPDHPDSNFRLLRDLFVKAGHVPQMIALKTEDTTPWRALPGLSASLLRALEEGPLFTVLALAENGHYASLFPWDETLESADGVLHVCDGPDHPRIGFAFGAFARARATILLSLDRDRTARFEAARARPRDPSSAALQRLFACNEASLHTFLVGETLSFTP